jgi:hypothetical protein
MFLAILKLNDIIKISLWISIMDVRLVSSHVIGKYEPISSKTILTTLV